MTSQYLLSFPQGGPFQPYREFWLASEYGEASSPGWGEYLVMTESALGESPPEGEPGSPQRQQQSGERGQHSHILPSPASQILQAHWGTLLAPCVLSTLLCTCCTIVSMRTRKSMLGHLGYSQKKKKKKKKFLFISWKRRNTEISTWRAGTSVYFIYLNTDILRVGACNM